MSSILIVGAGVVGQATGKGFARKGHSVDYVDVDSAKVNQLNQQGLFAMQPDQVNWNRYDIVMLTVSTPSINGRVKLDYIEDAALNVGHGLATSDKFVIVVVRSTVPPTTTEQRIRPLLEQASGKTAGIGFGLAMNPEFLRQRSNVEDFERPWITVVGTSERLTADILGDLYKPFGSLLVNCTPTEAEMIKYVNNIYNAVKISYFNEVHAICETLGIDSKIVGATVARSAESMWNPLYGTRGGVPYGGTCLPKDTVGFMTFCEEMGIDHGMLKATIAANERLAQEVAPVAWLDEVEPNVKAHSLPISQPAYTPQPV